MKKTKNLILNKVTLFSKTTFSSICGTEVLSFLSRIRLFSFHFIVAKFLQYYDINPHGHFQLFLSVWHRYSYRTNPSHLVKMHLQLLLIVIFRCLLIFAGSFDTLIGTALCLLSINQQVSFYKSLKRGIGCTICMAK